MLDAGGTDVSASSRWQRTGGDEAEVLFYAEAGSRHAVSLGTAGGKLGGEFTLRWDRAQPPAWLRYAGRLADGHRDRNDRPVEIRMAGGIAFGGDAFYLASGLGLSVFERDPASGGLAFVQFVDDVLERASLAWDGERSRLLAHDCETWRSFEIEGDGPGVAEPSTLAVADDPSGCGRLVVHPDGTFVYRIGTSGVDAFAIREGGGLRFADRYHGTDMAGAALSVDGFLYGSSLDDTLIVLRTDAETGELSETDTGEPLELRWWQDDPLLTAGADGALLFVDGGEVIHAFSLEDQLGPERLATLPRSSPQNPCVFASARGDSALDVFCEGRGYVAEWRADETAIAETDRIEKWEGDRFNNLVPDFGRPVGMAASPDGRHVYLSTAAAGILIFERVGNPGDAHRPSRTDGPDLVVVQASVDDPAPVAGASFRFRASVRNRGSTPADSSTLRVHRSPDATISTSDPEIATRAVDRLATDEDFDVSVPITAPSGAGTYYYGVCVDPADGESNTGNNCSNGVEVRVRSPQPDLIVQSPRVDDAAPLVGESFKLSTTVRNDGEPRSTAGETTLRYHRSPDSAVSSDDLEVGTDVVGRLDAGAERDHSISLAAPLTAGTHYYGACVDAVDGESDTTNNCSHGVETKVSQDDHGSTFATATVVAIPSTTTGELEKGGNRDYFRVAVDRRTTIRAETTGGTDTYGTLFDGNEEPLAENDDGGTGVNFRIETEVEAGDYYIEVRGFSTNTTGTYELKVSQE